MQKTRKGFTLVELVVVIAVIAILAGVLIGTFASVINKANASAKAQEIKQQEIEQKATDILKKLEESNWLGWEDFEANLVAKLTEVYKDSTKDSSITSDDVKKAVNDAFTTYMAAHQTETTGLTEEQVKAIIENALGTLDFSGVTEAQVKAIVTQATSTQVTASQVKAIVTAANANNLTANDVAKIVATANANSVEDIQTAIESASSTLATSEQVQEVLDYLSTTDSTNVILAKALNINISQKGITSASYPYAVVSALGGDSAVNSLPETVLLDLVDGAPVFFVVDSANKVVYDGGKATLTGTTLTDTYNYWTFADTVSDTYSTYLLNASTVSTIGSLKTGLDVGEHDEVTSIKYVGNAPSGQTVVIRTNNMFGTLTIDAITDEVSHFGDIGNLNIVAIKKSSYVEYGRVGGVATLTYGKINVKENAEITTIVGTAENSSDIELVVEDGGVVGTVISSDSDILDVLTVNGVNNAEEIDEGQIETVINSECYIKGETNVYYSKIQDAINAANGTTTIVITKDVLYENITGAALTIPQGKDITLELNGKIIQAYLTNSASSQLISLGGASHTQNTYLTIKDSTAPIGGVGTGMLYVLNSFESDPMNVATSVISANPMAYVTIKSGKIYNACTNSNSSMGYGMYGIDVLTNGGTGKDTTLIVDGGLVQSKNYRSIRGFCNATGSSVKITINGGSVVSDGNNAIWLQNPNSSQNKAELRINGGKIIAGPNGKLPVNGAAASSNFDVKYSGGQFFFGTQNIFYTYGYFNDDQFTDYYYGTVWGTIEDCENLGYYVVASEKYSGYYDVYYTPGMCVNAANEFVVEGKEFVKISEGLYEIR